MARQATRVQQVKSVALVSSGNFLEMYDFMVFAYYAKYVAAAYFPLANPVNSLLAAFMAFGAGFLTRPIGGLLLGAYVDRHGRRAGLIASIAIMALGTLSIAAMPSYAKIGLAAPILVLLGRLLQGVAAGVQVGGASVYLSEVAPPGRKGFYVAWQSASQQAAVVFAALVGFVANAALSKTQMSDFGWRIPFFIGCGLIPLLFVFRRWLEESPAYLAQKDPPTFAAIARAFLGNSRTVLLGAAMATMTTVFFYMITSYTPTYGNTVLKLSETSAFAVTMCVGLANFILLPTMGGVSDRFGRKPLLLGASIAAVLTSFPVLLWLIDAPSFPRLLVVELWLAFVYATYNGAMVVFLTEVMPASLRTTGFSFAYSLATAIFGGFTPAISTGLIRFGQDRGYDSAPALPGVWLSAAAAIGLMAVLALTRITRTPAEHRARGAEIDGIRSGRTL